MTQSCFFWSIEVVDSLSTRVMVVDDELTVAKLIQELLKVDGFVSEVFHDPRDALAAFERDPQAYSLMVTDQTMPGMSGSELAMTVMRLKPGFPVILCTGFSATIDKEAALAIGIKAFFTKPLDMGEFLDTVSQLLGSPGNQ
ncbi:MAG: response regulator [Gammaproteobacteria bacterium]|nr:response regulator [Gammaproteobacteria bacterium]